MTTTTGAYIRVVSSSGTSQSSTRRIPIRSSIAVPASVVAAEAEAIIEEDACIRAYHAAVPKVTTEEEEAEEREWESIISKLHVQDALRRMAAEARRQIALGETEEGGFAIE